MLVHMSSPFLRRPFVAAIALGLAATVVLAACSDDSDDESSSDRSTTTSSSGTPSSSAQSTTRTTSYPPLTPAPVDSCGDQLEFILDAVNESQDATLLAAKGQFTPQRCKLSESELIWAVVDLVPNPGSSFQETRALMERLGGRWTVHQLGTSNLGCDSPERARIELEIDCDDN
jgi:hypothetical protein